MYIFQDIILNFINIIITHLLKIKIGIENKSRKRQLMCAAYINKYVTLRKKE